MQMMAWLLLVLAALVGAEERLLLQLSSQLDLPEVPTTLDQVTPFRTPHFSAVMGQTKVPQEF